MFAPKITKTQKADAKSANRPMLQRSTPVGHRPGHDPVEQALFLQRTIGNQTTLRLPARRDSSLAGSGRSGDLVQETVEQNTTTRRAPRGVSWDFSKIPLFPPERASGAQPSFSPAATPIRNAIQAKLVIGQANDPLEQEADRVADQVMRTSTPWDPLTSTPRHISRKCATCGDEEKLQKHQETTDQTHAGEAPEFVHEVLRSPGQPLDASSRAFFEPRFGHDFSRVRMHTNQKAADSARAVNALAYTFGHNIIFNADQYAPATAAGMKLLAHELTHVVQQAAAGSAPAAGRTGPTSERIQRQPAGERATPRERPLGTEAERIMVVVRDPKRDIKSRAVYLVYNILNTYFPGYSSKISGVGYDDKQAANERLATKPTTDGKPYGFI